MVADDPESFADLDGHAGDDDIGDIIGRFVANAITTWVSDNAFGYMRPNPTTAEGKLGQSIGDFAAQQTGMGEQAAGTAGLLTAPETAEVPEMGTEGAVVQAAVSEALVAHGRVTTVIATANLVKDAAQTASSTKTEGPVKAKDAPGVTAGGQATNKHGQKLAPSGRPQVNNVTKNTRERANNAANKGSGTIEDEGHFHTRRGTGKKKRDGTHYNYPE